MTIRRIPKLASLLRTATLTLLALLIQLPAGFAAQEKGITLDAIPDDFKAKENQPRRLVMPQRSISLTECFDRAHEANKEIIASRYNLPVQQEAIQIASALANPRFNLQYGFGNAFTIIMAGNPQQFGWQSDIRTAGKRSKALNVANANYSLAELQVAALMFDVHNRVRRAYAEQAAAEAYASLIEAERKVALDLVRISEKRFQTGKGSYSDLLQAEVAVLQFDTQRNQAQLRLQQATSALSLIVGEVPQQVEIIDVDDNGLFKLSVEKSELVPRVDRPLPLLNELLPVADFQRPEMKVNVQQAFSDRRALTLAKSQRIPDVFIDTGMQFTTFYKQQPYLLFPGAPVPEQLGIYLNINAEMPIFYQKQGEILQAASTWRQDYEQIEQLRLQIATDVLTAYESVNVARANVIKSKQELLPEAVRVATMARRRYEVGKGDLASAILAQQQYQQMLSSYFDSVVAYQTAWADLEKAMGVPLKL